MYLTPPQYLYRVINCDSDWHYESYKPAVPNKPSFNKFASPTVNHNYAPNPNKLNSKSRSNNNYVNAKH